MKKNLYLIITAFILFSCNNSNSKSEENEAHEMAEAEQQATENESNKSEVENDVAIQPSSNTWSILYSASEDFLKKGNIIDVLPTPDGGCYFTTYGDVNINDGLRIVKKRISKLHKCTNFGEIEFSEILNGYGKMALTKQGNIFMASAEKYMLLNQNGKVIKEVPTEQSNYLYVYGTYCFGEDEFFVVGEFEEKGFILKLDNNLNILKNVCFDKRPVQKSVFDHRDEGFADASLINSISKSPDNCYYFTGRKNSLLWVGKLNNNLEKVWDRNDYVFERTGGRPERGSTIIYKNNEEIFLSSSYTNPNSASMVMCMNSNGNINWKTFLQGQLTNHGQTLSKVNNSLRLITYTSLHSERSSSSDNPFCTKIYHLTEKGELKNEQIVKWNELPIHGSAVVAAADSCYFVIGKLINSKENQERRNTPILAKYNEDYLLSNKYTDLTETDETNTLDIHLDLNNIAEVNKLLTYYDFRCYIKNGFTTVLAFNPSQDGNTGKVTFTMFKMDKKRGGFDIINNQFYNYTLDRSKVNTDDKLYFKTTMQGLITLSKEWELVMDDKVKNETYYFTKSDRNQ